MELKTKKLIAREGFILIGLVFVAWALGMGEVVSFCYREIELFDPCLFGNELAGMLVFWGYPALWLYRFMRWGIKTLKTDE